MAIYLLIFWYTYCCLYLEKLYLCTGNCYL